MNVLALDTTFGACSAALARGDRARIAARFERTQKGHAERIVPMIGEVLAETALNTRDIERIIVTRGPGTFTGMRIGIAVARALSLATGAEVESFSSLHLLSRQARAALSDEDMNDKDLAIVLNARRDELYFQLFDGKTHAPLTAPLLATPEEAAALLRRPDTLVAGSGSARLCEAANAMSRQPLLLADDLEPDARSLIELAGSGDRDGPLRPLYLRAPDAKPQAEASLA